MRKATTLLGVGLVIAVTVASGCNLAQGTKLSGQSRGAWNDRVLAIDPREYPRVGAMDHAVALPLTDKEVVLTFDDGPVPRYSNQILDILAAQCVKATFPGRRNGSCAPLNSGPDFR
jgi:peptidoglycan-N-acetylglucosamine deacetylase